LANSAQEEDPEEGEEAAAAVLTSAAAVRRKERELARKLLARERDTLAGVREALAAGSDRLIADVATDARSFGLSEADQARRARLKILAATPLMIGRIAGALVQGRADARGSALDDLQDDLERDLDVPDDGTDTAHSYVAAQSLGAVWAGLALRSVDPVQAAKRGGLAVGIRQALPLLDGRVRRTSATETAEAFNSERSDALIVVAKEMPELVGAGEEGALAPWPAGGGPYRSAPAPVPRRGRQVQRLVKVWSALLDRACPECRAMHGTAIEAGDTFDEGDPPRHPFCRCIFVIIATSASLEELEDAYDFDEAA